MDKIRSVLESFIKVKVATASGHKEYESVYQEALAQYDELLAYVRELEATVGIHCVWSVIQGIKAKRPDFLRSAAVKRCETEGG